MKKPFIFFLQYNVTSKWFVILQITTNCLYIFISIVKRSQGHNFFIYFQLLDVKSVFGSNEFCSATDTNWYPIQKECKYALQLEIVESQVMPQEKEKNTIFYKLSIHKQIKFNKLIETWL